MRAPLRNRGVSPLAVALLLGPTAASGAPDADQVIADYRAQGSAIAANAVYPIAFSDDELRAAVSGEVVRRWEKLDGADRVVGLAFTPIHRDDLWLAIQDSDNWDGVVKGLTEEVLPGTTADRKLLFQHIELPWPLYPRQWVIEITNTRPLLAATEDRVWERTWTPSPARNGTKLDPSAVWVEVNDGGWTLVQTRGGMVVSYHGRTVVGGVVPDSFATRYAYATLSSMIEELFDRAADMDDHYSGDHPPILRPDGTAIPVRGAMADAPPR